MEGQVLRVVVFGWYFKQNLGDDLFVEAFRTLFPSYELTFVNHLTKTCLAQADAVFFGGGSILEGALSIDADAWECLRARPIFYIGVGVETKIHPDHQGLLQQARLIAVRSSTGMEKLRGLSAEVLVTPDLVYALGCARLEGIRPASILFLPNVSVVPGGNDPYWKHTAWEFFKSETAQFLDEAIDRGTSVRFLPMCQNAQLDDNWAAIEIANKMRNRNRSLFLDETLHTAADALRVFSRYNVVLTQRFHGIVLAEMAGTPCVSIYHHDKLKSDLAIPYFGVSKSVLTQAKDAAKQRCDLPTKSHFITLQARVGDLIS